MKKTLILVSLLLLLPLLVGCFSAPSTTNQSPTITSTPITTATVAAAYAYNVNGTDPDGDTLTYSLNTNPAAITINSTTGVISWTPTSTQIGDHNVTVKVSDGALSDTQSFIITVSKAPIIYPPHPTVVPVSAISVTPTTMTLLAGGATGTITATVSPSNATNKNVGWTSSNTAVATVAGGVVTPLAAGTANITVTTVDGSFTATSAVTVSGVVPGNASVTPTAATFDKAAQADVAITLTPNGRTVTKINDGTADLVLDTDYTLAGNVYTIKSAYLAAKANGDVTLTFNMSGGTNPTCAVTVSGVVPVMVNNSTELVAAGINSAVSTIVLGSDITLTESLVLNHNAKTVNLNGHSLTTTGYAITATANDSTLKSGTIVNAAAIIGGAGTGFSVEGVVFSGALTTANTAELANNISFLNGSVTGAITSTSPAKEFDGTALTAAITPGTGTIFTHLTITGAVTASLAATYNNVEFIGAVTASVVASTFTACTFRAAVTNTSGDSNYTGSTFNGAVTNTAGDANYTNAIFNGAVTNTSGNAIYTGATFNSTFTNSGGVPVLSATNNVDLALTTPVPGGGNAIAGGGATKTVNVDVVNGTTLVVITGTKTATQTVVKGGADVAYVTLGGSATAPTYTVDTTDIAVAGGSKVFTLTVSETGKTNIVYTVTVVVAGP